MLLLVIENRLYHLISNSFTFIMLKSEAKNVYFVFFILFLFFVIYLFFHWLIYGFDFL